MGVEIPSQEEFQGLRLTDLKIDQAYVNVVRSTESVANNEKLYLYTREENCYGCPFQYFDGYFRAKVRLFPNMAITKSLIHFPSKAECYYYISVRYTLGE